MEPTSLNVSVGQAIVAREEGLPHVNMLTQREEEANLWVGEGWGQGQGLWALCLGWGSGSSSLSGDDADRTWPLGFHVSVGFPRDGRSDNR